MVRAGMRGVVMVWALLSAGLALGQVADVAGQVAPGQPPKTLPYTAVFAAGDLQFGSLQGYDTVQMEDGLSFDAPGWPMLPSVTLRIALPTGMAVTGLRVVRAEGQELPGEYTLYPAQRPRRMSDPVDDTDFVAPDPAAYASTDPYPAALAEFMHESDLAGQAMAEVRFHPVRYVAAEKKLTFYSEIEVVLEGTGGYVCGDYLSAALSAADRADLEDTVRSMVANPQDVMLELDPQQPPHKLGVGAGSYVYVIITQDSWVTNFQPLADWKTKKGRPTTIVTTTWIYNSGGYSGTNQQKLRAFVIDANSTWGATFFLLGGDTNVIPASSKTFSSVDPTAIPNDTYYADYDDDYVCEVHVGRAACRTTTHISTFVNKALAYEKSPPTTDYAKTAFFYGFDLNSCGSGEGGGLKQAIYTLYLPTSWTYRKVYDSDTGNHKTNSTAYLNQGNNLVNHSDHADTNVMGCGYVCHNYTYANADMTALTNGSRQSLQYSLGCWACDYNATTCIAEAFVQNANGGGYAFVGNSRYGWYTPGSTDGVSAHFDRYFFRSIFSQGYTRVGTAFSNHKNTAYSADDYMRYIFTELTLLGDPELPLLTEDPQSLTVTHPTTLSIGVPNSFPVHVTVGGSPLNAATVCLWKGTEIYQYQSTNSNGDATFTVTPTTAGTMYVTVACRNYLPYEGTATAAATWTLTVNVVGQGRVDLTPPGGVYANGTPVQLAAVADPGWHFDHWSGDLSGSANPAIIQMTSNKTVTATFVQDQYTLTVNVSGSGSVLLNPPGGSYASNTTVQLTAQASPGWHFDHWSGDLSGSTNPTTILMNGNKTVTATFVQDQYTLTVNVNGSGSVQLNPPGGSYAPNTTVQLTAQASPGWHFDHWSGDLSGSANPTTILMNANHTVTATFGLIGDMNCDGLVNNQDIDGFVQALFDAAGYVASHPDCLLLNGDFTGDGLVNSQDIDGFVDLLL